MTIAEEIEQSGMEGCVVMSESTHEHCHHSFNCRLLKPLSRSAAGTVTRIPRYEVLGLSPNGHASRQRAERVNMLDELSALPKVVLEILRKVIGAASTPAGSSAHDETAPAAAAQSNSTAGEQNRERMDAVAAAVSGTGWAKPRSGAYRDRAISELTHANGQHNSDSSSSSNFAMPLLSEDEKERE